MSPGPASIRLHEAVLACLREAVFSIETTIQAYSVQDAYIYGSALQEKSIPFEGTEESTAVAEEREEHTRQLAELQEQFPYLAEVAEQVAEVGYDFTEAFEYGPRPHPRRTRAAARHDLSGRRRPRA